MYILTCIVLLHLLLHVTHCRDKIMNWKTRTNHQIKSQYYMFAEYTLSMSPAAKPAIEVVTYKYIQVHVYFVQTTML